MTKKIWILNALVLLVLLTIIVVPKMSLSPKSARSERSALQNTPITIGYSNWAGWWPWAIAESQGLFAKHKVNVNLKWYDNYSESLNDLAAGAIDGNSQTLNDTINFAKNALKGEVVVLVNDNSAGNDKIIAASGISDIKDLKHKQVLIEGGVVDDFLLGLALDKAGISRSQIEMIDVETGAAVAAFAAGRGDAVGAFPPFWLEALKRKGAKEIISSKDFPGAISDLLVVTREMATERPEEVQALINVWFDILKFMEKNSAEADQIMAIRAQVNSKDLKLFKEGIKMFSLEDNLIAFSDGQEMKFLPYAARQIADFLDKNTKNFETIPNLNKLFDSHFIKSAAAKVNR